MPDTETPTNPFASALSGFFFSGDKNDPRVNPQLRQRIALAMMASHRPYPKNLGEGLSAIGEAIGERGQMKALMDADIAQQGINPPPPAGAAPGQSASLAPSGDVDTAPAVRSAGAPEVAPLPPQVPQKVAPVVVSDGGFNSMDAAADAPQPGDQGTTPGRFANVRYNNPGAAYPGQDATAFGSTGTDTIGGGHKIAQFPTPVHGAAANMSLLERNYTGMPVSAAISKWSGGGRNTVPGFDPNAIVTPELARDPRFMQAIVGGEAPGKYPMSPAQWQMASEWAAQGGPPPGEGGPRDRIAATLAQQQQPPSSQRPSVADYGQPRALAATPPDNLPPEIATGASAISAAPPQPSGIRAAPPQQVAQAQPQAIPGYVPPEAKDPTAAPIIGMKPREVELRNWLVQNQNNPYAAAKVAPELQALEQERTIRQNEANELYKANIARATEQNKLRTQAQIDQAQRIAAEAHTKAQTEKEKQITNPEDTYYQVAPGVVRPIKVEGEDPNAAPGGKLSENEQKTLIYHGWAKLGNQAITGNDQLLAHGMAQEALGKIPFVGNQAQDAEYRRAKNGADNFILSFMRSTSGAAYGVPERLDHAKAMLPKIGDDAKTLADKAAQRQQFIDTEYAGLGKQAQKKADYIAKNYDPGSAANQQRLVDMEMQGVKGGQVGEVKTNKNPKSPDFGKQRMWNGSRWVEAN